MNNPQDFKINEVVCVGAGYVGTVSTSILAKMWPNLKVTIVDKDEKRINAWNSEKLPIYEPQLEEIVKETRARNLCFSHQVQRHLETADLVFICVNTPNKSFGMRKGRASDLTYLESCAESIKKFCQKDHIIVVEKSTVPVTYAQKIYDILNGGNKDNTKFYIISNPEFLREGCAVADTLYPDRIVIGGLKDHISQAALKAVSNLYLKWVDSSKILTTDLWSSELSKLVSNAFLAQKLSSINSVCAICELTNADVVEVLKCVGSDTRIGKNFMTPSLGFGGSCFQKDVLCLVYVCESLGLTEVAEYWHGVIEINKYQRKRFVNRIFQSFGHDVRDKRICIFGAAFKKDTSDFRESSSVYVVLKLIYEGAKLIVCDPCVNSSEFFSFIKSETKGKIDVESAVAFEIEPYAAVRNSDAIVVCTEWDLFKNLDYKIIFDYMNKPAYIFDGRLIIDQEIVTEIGFKIFTLGRTQTSIN